MSGTEELTKIVLDLPNHWATGGEAMWALPLGESLYELRNVPFYAYGLNFGDVVRAIEPSGDKKPVIAELVEAGGHRTLRVIFFDAIAEPEQPELLNALGEFKASFEGAGDGYFAIDIEPDGNYEAVCDRLEEWEKAGHLEYETCETRIEGSFDGPAEEDEDEEEAG